MAKVTRSDAVKVECALYTNVDIYRSSVVPSAYFVDGYGNLEFSQEFARVAAVNGNPSRRHFMCMATSKSGKLMYSVVDARGGWVKGEKDFQAADKRLERLNNRMARELTADEIAHNQRKFRHQIRKMALHQKEIREAEQEKIRQAEEAERKRLERERAEEAAHRERFGHIVGTW